MIQHQRPSKTNSGFWAWLTPRRAGWIIGAALFAQVFWLNVFRVHDPDTWWHLKTGELIWTTRSIPRVDPYSYVLKGSRWVAFEWLSQLIFYLAFHWGGPAALTTLKATVIGSAFLVFFSLGGAGFWAGIVLSLAALTTRGSFFERPQIFDFLLIGLFLSWIENPRSRRALWWKLPLAEILWVNLHGGAALLGVGIVGLKVLSAFVERRAGERLGSARRWALLAALCLACMLVNPNGWALFAHLVKTLNFPGREMIQEWRPLPSFLNWHGVFYALALASVFLSWKLDPHLSALAVALGGMGMRAVRHLSLFVLTASALAARALERRLPVPPGPSSTGGALLAILLLSWVYGTRLSVDTSHLFGFGLKEYPEGAVAFLENNRVEGRMFNEYGLGGYLIWKCWPERKVFVDGRNVEYGPAFVRKAVRWHEPAVWKELDAAWRFDYAVIANSESYLAKVLDDSADWVLVYWDDAALVYLRREPRNEELILRYGYRYLQPNHISYAYLEPALRDPKAAPSVLYEINRSVREARQNVNAYQLRAFALGLSGREDEAFRDLEEAAKRFPFKPGPFISLGWWYEGRGRLAEARDTYRRALDLARREQDPLSTGFIYNNLGALEYKLGDRRKARALFLQALRTDPRQPQALENLRRLYGR